MENFLENITELLDSTTTITPEMRLEEVGEWDSMNIISFLAMVDVEYGKTMKVADFKGAKTFGDLYTIVMGS